MSQPETLSSSEGDYCLQGMTLIRGYQEKQFRIVRDLEYYEAFLRRTKGKEKKGSKWIGEEQAWIIE